MFTSQRLPNDFLDLADLFLNLPANIFGFAFGFQVAFPDCFSRDLFDLTLHLVPCAFGIVLVA
jgi:hypothetical protein